MTSKYSLFPNFSHVIKSQIPRLKDAYIIHLSFFVFFFFFFDFNFSLFNFLRSFFFFRFSSFLFFFLFSFSLSDDDSESEPLEAEDSTTFRFLASQVIKTQHQSTLTNSNQ